MSDITKFCHKEIFTSISLMTVLNRCTTLHHIAKFLSMLLKELSEYFQEYLPLFCCGLLDCNCIVDKSRQNHDLFNVGPARWTVLSLVGRQDRITGKKISPLEFKLEVNLEIITIVKEWGHVELLQMFRSRLVL